MQRLLDVDRIHAMALASAVVDVRITQLVNGVRGAHARLHPEVFSGNARNCVSSSNKLRTESASTV